MSIEVAHQYDQTFGRRPAFADRVPLLAADRASLTVLRTYRVGVLASQRHVDCFDPFL
jgi:hypothetical protein